VFDRRGYGTGAGGVGEDFLADAADVAGCRRCGTATLPDHDWVVRFLKAIGSDPAEFPPDMLATALPLVPLLRRGRPFFEADIPVDDLRRARFPKLVVSGGHHPGFDAVCRDVAMQIDGQYRIVEGAGHEIQFTGAALNELLLTLWRGR
jgi:hypothetical protein